METFSEFVVHKKFQSHMASFSEDKLCHRQHVSKAQFSSTMGLGNEMKLKSGLGNEMKLKLRLLQFSLVLFGVSFVRFVFSFLIFSF